MLIQISVHELRQAFKWLAWGIIALTAINLIIVLFVVQSDPRSRRVLVAADVLVFALTFGALYMLRRKRAQ